MKIRDITDIVERACPLELAEDWDNPGLSIGDADAECTGVVTCLDCTPEVCERAEEEGCNLILSHHPFIFRPVSSLTADTVRGRCAAMLMRAGISVYSAHTNLDAAETGLCIRAAELIGGRNARIADGGCVAEMEETTAAELAKLAARTLGDGTARVTAPQKTVRRVFVVTGAGGSDEYLAAARRNADALITGEVKHHIFTEASILEFPVIEVSHYDSEIMCCEVLSDMIKSEFSDLKVVKAPNSRPYKTLEEL